MSTVLVFSLGGGSSDRLWESHPVRKCGRKSTHQANCFCRVTAGHVQLVWLRCAAGGDELSDNYGYVDGGDLEA